MTLLAVIWLAFVAVPPDQSWCSGSGQGPIDCPRDYPKPKRKKK